MYLFLVMEVLKDMFPNMAEEDLLLTMNDNNFELEEAISDILIKTSPFEQAGTVLTAIEPYCFSVEYVNDPNLYRVTCAQVIIFSILNFVVKALITVDVNFFR